MSDTESVGIMTVLVTGASGFIGSAVVARLEETPAMRVVGCSRAGGRVLWASPELSDSADWSGLLAGVDCVIHTAGRAHVLAEEAQDSLAEFRRVNVLGTLRLAGQAAAAGVKRFLFISSIGVNGNCNTRPYTESDTPQPAEPYAQSKWEAEQGLWEIQRETGMEVVIIRPPLVYGPDAPGNFGLLSKVATKGLPLPLAGIRNRRSFVSVWNLVDFIVLCIDHPRAAGQTFLVADGEDVSTSELLRKLARAAVRPSRLFWLPAPLLKAGATALGKRGIYDRLFDSLQVDARHARRTLGWVPPLSLDEGLARCFRQADEGPVS
ncbi:NAD-dependent epimerase/dehydratase family protein [Halomonas lysinitropha]|uniref:UDP-glucose 4-epimerase n=1 Tax=Halomonas lysinitropha TaxID=2607506 RepID=A0A5K1I9Q7_9GAMM|nr:NAD-dependent epimerase/dehydratase family protein [Halomonas lysinitropha]VVZ97083.1 UDP-glucose 4-epimerase [Halomonas lysinitropha]